MRADFGAGLAKDEGVGMAMRGDSGRVRVAVLALLENDAALVSLTKELDDAVDSYDVFRDNEGCELGGVMDGLSLDTLSDVLSWKLNRVLVLEGAGLSMAGDMLLRKSR